ncbi:hypothetical protein SAMN04488107_2371 [Geodermatophilus saharensis]|uniref:EcsC protein family protein n=1 Tax=Geodermatophilus saharensis TaxID=1137994 RepID=A0A239E457_9ACTN|nr:hypothetical protein [Geodermatophilus saharensis]SNS39387.1 hypothetical protein SAMN04488107_2371 [Geodermatophilus saharensis]
MTGYGAPRDVPPPRPVPRPADPGPPGDVPEAETGLGRAARAVADAVSGLLGGTADDAEGPDGPRRPTAGLLRDVVGAVASAAAAATARGGDVPGAAPPPGDGGGRGLGPVLGELLATAAPRLPVRDAARLRAAHPGRSDEEIADALTARASRLTAAVGAATGGLSAAHWLVPPSLLALPLELGAETLLTAAVEVVLLGELHELHGRPAVGDDRERAAAYLSSWAAQRALDGGERQGLGVVLGTAGLRSLSRRLTTRMARGVGAAAPLLVGAAIGGRLNLKATEALARRVRADLRRPRS